MIMAELFESSELPERKRPGTAPTLGEGEPRLRIPVRDQVEFRSASLDELLPSDHEARVVWEAVCRLDLEPWLKEVKAVEGHVGRKATDPRLLVALWVYATLQGEGSAREIDRLCTYHAAYQWLCGGVQLNYHTLADFRSRGGDKWDALLTELVGSLMAAGLVTLQCVAQDGMRVRANAGKSSFRREGTLQQCLAQAQQQVETLKRLADENPDELTRRKRAARERAARERLQRIEEALVNRQQLEAEREKRAKTTGEPAKEARASTTDPQARHMKFANGGYAPGYNTQFMTDVHSGIVVGVEVTGAGSDGQELPPMLNQVKKRYEKAPDLALVDGGFATKEAITDAAENHGCTVYAPLKDLEKQLAKGTDPYAKKKGDTPAVAAWRQRMGTVASKLLYKLRSQTAEWVNAQCRNHGLWQMPLRGQPKCRIVALLQAISHNLMQAVNLRAKAVKTTS
jgi:transposase